MSDEKDSPSSWGREAFRQGVEDARITSRGDAIARAAIVTFALGVALVTLGAWYWKAGAFVGVMLVAGIVMPAIRRSRDKSGKASPQRF